jgi:hypothetical protein
LIKIPSEQTLWKVVALGFGLIFSIAVIFVMQFINYSLYPIDEGYNLNLDQQYADFVKYNPLFLAGIWISNATGSFSGGALARLVRYDLSTKEASVIGLVLMVLGYLNMAAMPHPVWFWIISAFAFIPFSWYGAYIIDQRTQ